MRDSALFRPNVHSKCVSLILFEANFRLIFELIGETRCGSDETRSITTVPLIRLLLLFLCASRYRIVCVALRKSHSKQRREIGRKLFLGTSCDFESRNDAFDARRATEMSNRYEIESFFILSALASPVRFARIVLIGTAREAAVCARVDLSNRRLLPPNARTHSSPRDTRTACVDCQHNARRKHKYLISSTIGDDTHSHTPPAMIQ